jgi:hypothetical protein
MCSGVPTSILGFNVTDAYDSPAGTERAPMLYSYRAPGPQVWPYGEWCGNGVDYANLRTCCTSVLTN